MTVTLANWVASVGGPRSSTIAADKLERFALRDAGKRAPIHIVRCRPMAVFITVRAYEDTSLDHRDAALAASTRQMGVQRGPAASTSSRAEALGKLLMREDAVGGEE